jgi:hypothetical protein
MVSRNIILRYSGINKHFVLCLAFLVLVQDKATGRVTTIIDNRAALAVQRMAAGSEEGKKVMNQLLTGSSGGK